MVGGPIRLFPNQARQCRLVQHRLGGRGQVPSLAVEPELEAGLCGNPMPSSRSRPTPGSLNGFGPGATAEDVDVDERSRRQHQA